MIYHLWLRKSTGASSLIRSDIREDRRNIRPILKGIIYKMILELSLTCILCPLVENPSISSVTSPLSFSKRAKDHLVCNFLFVPSPVEPRGIYGQGDADGRAVRDSTFDSQSATGLPPPSCPPLSGRFQSCRASRPRRSCPARSRNRLCGDRHVPRDRHPFRFRYSSRASAAHRWPVGFQWTSCAYSASRGSASWR